MLEIDQLTVTYGRAVGVSEVDLTVADASVLCLLGPSGCGKSTLLRAIAGIEPSSAGRILWDGTDLSAVPVHRRGFGLMFQAGVLFPHLDVAGNVAYGLRRGFPELGRTGRRARVEELLELVGLPGFGNRRVTTLSGGQAQRVALARALAPEPRLLLLDEPLAALDAELRERLVRTLREVLTSTGTTAVYVTHDQNEAFAVGDTVALMDAGRIEQVGPPAQVWTAPASRWVAGFVGFTSMLDRNALRAVGLLAPGDGDVVAVRPSAFVVDPGGPVAGTCIGRLPGPETIRLRLSVDGLGEVEGITTAGLDVQPGQSVRLRFESTSAAPLPG